MPVSLTATLNDTVAVVDVVGEATVHSGLKSSTRNPIDSVGVVDSLSRSRTTEVRSLSNAVGLSGYLAKRWQLRLPNTVGLSSAAISISTLIQYDTWRPIPRPDNKLILACRTPVGDHDTTLTNITLWTFQNDGSYENVVREIPSTYSWTTYGHPEWSPDGNEVVIYAEDSTTYALVVLDATGFDRAES